MINDLFVDESNIEELSGTSTRELESLYRK